MILTFPFKGHIIVTERTPASFGPGVFLLKFPLTFLFVGHIIILAK